MSENSERERERQAQIRRMAVLAGLALLLGGITIVRDVLPMATAALTPVSEDFYTPDVFRGVDVTPTEEETGPGNEPQATPEPSPTATPAVEVATAIPTDMPPLRGSFDAYLGAPDADGVQLLRFVNTDTGQTATEITIQTDGGRAIRAGQYVYYHALSTRRPMRVNTAGAVKLLEFAMPVVQASYYQLLPSANGSWLAWVSVNAEGTQYAIGRAFQDGSAAATMHEGEIEPGTEIELLRLTNDGRTLFFSLLPASVEDRDTPFNQRQQIYALEMRTGTVTAADDGATCPAVVVCDAHVSPDGAYLALAAPPTAVPAPVTVTNLFSHSVIARYGPPVAPLGVDIDLGYPFFTPGGELIYMQAVRRPDNPSYRLVFANIVTGEQQVLVDLGEVRHRPLGWTGEGFVLLTTREPGYYDTWQIDVRDGTVRQVSDLMYLGFIPAPAPG